MGSLMAGWSSLVNNSKSDIYERNRSLTNEEIEAFWRSNKKSAADDEKHHIPSPDSMITTVSDKPSKIFQKSISFPETRSTDQPEKYFMHGEAESMASGDDKQTLTKHGWWTTSNWAFLNEPPEVDEGPSRPYKSQFHVANSSGIST